MPRYLWAMVDVQMRNDQKLFGRPDCDFRLWTCLILYAKELAPDGQIRGLTAEDLRGMFGIKAPLKAVDEALAHFVKVKMTRWLSLDGKPGDFVMVNLSKRQSSSKDNPAAAAERQRRKRERDRVVTGDVTEAVTGDKTRDASVMRHAEEEEEEEEENSKQSRAREDVAAAWDSDLLDRLRSAIGKTELTSKPFADFLLSANVLKHPKARRQAAIEKFLADGKKIQSFGYLVRMIEGGAHVGEKRSDGNPQAAPAANPGPSKATQAAHDQAEREHREAVRKERADRKAAGLPPFPDAKALVRNLAGAKSMPTGKKS